MITRKITRSGYDECRAELDTLKESRPHALHEMTRMRELGDLSENAGYRASKRKLMQIDRRIRYLEHFLSRVEIVVPLSHTQVGIGNVVCVSSENMAQKTIMIVESHEADLSKQKISSYSPLGKALLNREVGDVVQIITQKGKKQYKIEKIS